MTWRTVGVVLLLSAAGFPFAACATGTGDSGDGTATDAAPSMMPMTTMDGAPSSTSTAQRDAAPPAMDSGTNVDSAPPNPYADSGLVYDGAGVDANIEDVVIPDVYVPPGTTSCNYFGSGADFAKYVGECFVFQSVAATCAGGCPSGACCAALCSNSSNEALCLPQ